MAAFHQRGLAHCDLKRAPNTLLGTDGVPYIVDWAASISKSELWFPPFNLVFRRFMLDDEMAIVKLALRHCPERVSAERKARYHYRSWGGKKDPGHSGQAQGTIAKSGVAASRDYSPETSCTGETMIFLAMPLPMARRVF